MFPWPRNWILPSDSSCAVMFRSTTPMHRKSQSRADSPEYLNIWNFCWTNQIAVFVWDHLHHDFFEKTALLSIKLTFTILHQRRSIYLHYTSDFRMSFVVLTLKVEYNTAGHFINNFELTNIPCFRKRLICCHISVRQECARERQCKASCECDKRFAFLWMGKFI